MKKVTHLIVGLGKGGAETMLYQVLQYQQAKDLQYTVISLGMGDYYEEYIRKLGIPLIVLPLNKSPLRSLLKLRKLLLNVDTLVCWMYHANFLGYLFGVLCRIKNIVWFIRHSNLDPAMNKKRTLLLNKLCSIFSKSNRITNIAYNGRLACEVHESIGYCRNKSIILDNGCDTNKYRPLLNARKQIQNELKIEDNAKIVLSLTRYHPIKDVPNFIEAFAGLFDKNRNIVAILCGTGITPENHILVDLCQQIGLRIGKDIFLLGLRHDIPALLSACDLYVLHSAGEAFPNVLIQAMSCECVCLTTDVGDAGVILNRPDCVVPPQNLERLQLGMEHLLSFSTEEARKMSEENRRRVLDNFDIHNIMQSYEKVFRI